MANELTLSVRLHLSKSGTEVEWNVNNLQVDVTGTNVLRHRQEIGTSEEAITVGDVTVGGYLMAKNHGSTVVDIRGATGVQGAIQLPAGGVCLFPVDSGATLYGQATTSAAEVEFLILEA